MKKIIRTVLILLELLIFELISSNSILAASCSQITVPQAPQAGSTVSVFLVGCDSSFVASNFEIQLIDTIGSNNYGSFSLNSFGTSYSASISIPSNLTSGSYALILKDKTTAQVILQSIFSINGVSPDPNPNQNAGGTGIQCSDGNSINTAIGCIPINDQNALIGFFLKWGIGIGGGIAFLLIIFAGFQIISSRGDPNRLKAGQELMTSAIAGLLLLIFSLVILKIIGVDILQIPGFSA